MSYNFDGTNDYLYTNTKPVSAVGFTVAMWVKRHNYGDVTNVGWMLGDIGVATDQYFIKFDASGTPIMGVAAAGSPDQTYCTAEVTQNVWSHVAAVFATDSSRTVYVHGGNATSDSTSITPTWSNIEQMRLGTSMTDGQDFDGQMAHVAVWNTALTAQNIAALAAGANPSTIAAGNLVAYWPLTANLEDSIGTNDLTISGNTNLVTPTDDPTLTAKTLKLLAHSSAAGATGVSGIVWASSAGLAGAEIGEFTGKSFSATLESGKAVLKVPVADFGGTSLTTSDTPVALVKTSTKTTGLVTCTVIEE